MTTCKSILPRLTAYLDGELADELGSVVRGHLRECAACRQSARDEGGLRDSLRTLPPVDPPASLWAGVQAQLAAAEVADAHRPRWRRVFARWTPSMPRFAAGGLLVAAAVVMLYWRTHRVDESPAGPVAIAPPALPAPPGSPDPVDAHRQMSQQVSVPAADDVTADLLDEPARTTASHDQVIEELMKLASEARAGWTDERAMAFDAKVATWRAMARHLSQASQASQASQGRALQRAQRDMIRYLQGAVVRDEVVLASGGMQ